MPTAFQDCYPERFSHCFGCGKSNPQGHHLKSYWEGEETVARFTARPGFSGGVPGHVFGGKVSLSLSAQGQVCAKAEMLAVQFRE